MELQAVQELSERLRGEVHKAVIGGDGVIDLLLTTLLAEGHILLEGVPGTAKTLLARSFSSAMSLQFGRIQFTPDLMPGDVLGTNLFNFQTNQFVLTKGPIFTELLLADEINRTPPKTQAALLEAMQERSVTIDGKTHALGRGFMVIATQNPIEQEGTYPLPEAQLDRFLFKVVLDYPDRDLERQIVQSHGRLMATPEPAAFGVAPVADLGAVMAARAAVGQVRLSDELIDYVVDVVRATRSHPSLQYGASPRAASMLASATRAYAALCGRDYAIPDDVKMLVPAALRHRVVLSPGAEIEGLDSGAVIAGILDSVAAPR